jgi:hypothetical protein
MPPGVGKLEWLPYFISSHSEMTSFHDKHGKAVFRVKTVPNELARSIAKIGYSYAVAEFGWGSFDPLPHTLDIILCRTNDVAFTVGGEMELRPPIPDAGHITIPTILIPQHFHPPLLVLEIRLFASIDTPNFHVVVGTFNLQNPQHFRTFSEKMRDAEPEQLL